MSFTPRIMWAAITGSSLAALHFLQSQELINRSDKNTQKLDNSRRLAQEKLLIGFPVPVSDLGAKKAIKYERKQYVLDRVIQLWCCRIWGREPMQPSQKIEQEDDQKGLKKYPYSWNTSWNLKACESQISGACEHSLDRANRLNDEVKVNLKTINATDENTRFYDSAYNWNFSLDVLSNDLSRLAGKFQKCFRNNDCKMEQIGPILEASEKVIGKVESTLTSKVNDSNEWIEYLTEDAKKESEYGPKATEYNRERGHRSIERQRIELEKYQLAQVQLYALKNVVGTYRVLFENVKKRTTD